MIIRKFMVAVSGDFCVVDDVSSLGADDYRMHNYKAGHDKVDLGPCIIVQWSDSRLHVVDAYPLFQARARELSKQKHDGQELPDNAIPENVRLYVGDNEAGDLIMSAIAQELAHSVRSL